MGLHQLLATRRPFHLSKDSVDTQRVTSGWWKLLESLQKLCHERLGRDKHPHLVSVEIAYVERGIRTNLEGVHSQVDDQGPAGCLAISFVDRAFHDGEMNFPVLVTN